MSERVKYAVRYLDKTDHDVEELQKVEKEHLQKLETLVTEIRTVAKLHGNDFIFGGKVRVLINEYVTKLEKYDRKER